MLKKSNIGNIRISDTSAKVLAENVKAVYSVKKVRNTAEEEYRYQTGEDRMKEERMSNYVKLCEEWAQRFLKMDQADLHKRVPELKEENGFLTIIHFGRKYGVSLEDGSIRSLDGQREPDTTEMLNIYTLLGYAKEGLLLWISGSLLLISGMQDHLRRRIRSERRMCSVLHFPVMKRN